jgi:hypothetical protein
MRHIYFILTILLTTLASCDCAVRETGIVVDGTTGEPLEDVTVTFDKRTFKTDSDGRYKIDYITGFCPDRHFVFEKEKYKPMELKIEQDGDELSYTVNTKDDFIDYDNPKYVGQSRKTFTVGEWVDLTSKNFSVRNDTLTIFLDTMNWR